MDDFAKMMIGSSTTEFARAVDHTGLKGGYDLTALESAKNEEPGITFVDAWIEAMPRQLGLELKRDKADMQILIIDHVEKVPTGN